VHPAVRKIEIRHEINDEFQPDFPEVTVPHTPGDVYYLRLQKRGTEYTGLYSLDGTTWEPIAPDPVVNTALTGANVGVYAFGQEQTTSTTVGFDYFHLVESGVSDTTPPETTATLTPATPDGDNDWYVSPVEVTLAATDDDSGVARTEYSLDGGETWTTYSATFEVDADGEHTVAYRSTDEAGNIELAKSVSFKIDGTAPQATCTAMPSELFPPDLMLKDVTVDVQMTDATSGPGGFTLLSVTSSDPDQPVPGDIQGWDVGTADIAGQLRAELGARGRARVYTIRYEARDAAGNTADCEAKVTVRRRPGPPTR
jgi:cytochrome c